jgi:hypothetical protein
MVSPAENFNHGSFWYSLSLLYGQIQCCLCAYPVPSRLRRSAISLRRKNVLYVAHPHLCTCLTCCTGDDCQTILFSRAVRHEEDTYVNLFSVLPQGSHSSVKNRVVVEHNGNDDGDGEWKCYRDSKSFDCVHIIEARHTLQKYLHGDPNATDLHAQHGAHQGITSFNDFYTSIRLNKLFR